ncbi:hypothetical protein PTE30175_01481 [Pandoraea terrae]|uniref:DUF2894 domain-containing protein n=1 Tax=Pandoraea terrae TaxID=1537710 RepID=A0A5E4TQZ9_9BURK|nr:DUF2894 domain-containing protein [Pandoraea terrae]VVD89573.1 hypothetical protein PTE30175_01481 [Pandoraea terrae]
MHDDDRDEGLDVRATLDAWRAQGADAHDRVRFHRIEATARRADAYSGEARRVLDARLGELIDAFSRELSEAGTVVATTSGVSDGTADGPRDATTSSPAPTALAALVADMARRTDERRVAPVASLVVRPTGVSADAPIEDMDVLEYFRETWSRVSTDGNLRQSLAQVPENAGPLNSSHLVHRALSLMHDVSPDYLRHFLRHAEALSWLEDMEASGLMPGKSAARAATAGKSSRAKTR